MKRLVFLFFIVFSTFSVFAAMPVEGVKIKGFGKNFLEINFVLPSYKLVKVKTKGGEFLRIEGEGFGYVPDYGKAMLPTVSFSVTLNSLQKPEIEIVSFEQEEITLDRRIYPVQKPVPKSRKIQDTPFTMDYAYYNSEIKESPIITLSNVYKIRDKAGISLTIHPFQYNPKKNTLTVYKKIKIKIVGAGIDTSPVSKVFEKIYSSSFVNYFIPETSKTKTVSGERILIITPSQYTDELASFVQHKQSLGYTVDVFTLDETGTSESQIVNFIKARYDNADTRPDFVILVGDTDAIPSRYLGTVEWNTPFYTDLYYSLFDGNDYFPDVALGRFSVRSGEELTNLINKIVYMENNIGNLSKKALFLGGYDSDFYMYPINTHDYVSERYFIPDGYSCEKLYRATMGVTVSQISYSVNQGQDFVVYSGHGSPSEWYLDYGVEFKDTDVKALGNTVYPFVFSFACQTGQLEADESFGEAWIRAEKGASSFWGSTVYSYWDEDDVLEKEVFKARFGEGILRIGPMFNKGKIAFYNYYSGQGSTERYFQQYNLFGDPSLFTGVFLPSSMGYFNVEKETVSCGQTVKIELWDSDLSDSSVTVKAVNTVDGTETSLVLNKTGEGVYSADLNVSDICGEYGGIIELEYFDYKYGEEGGKTVKKEILVDCQPPYVTSNKLNFAYSDSASYLLRFNEPVEGTVTVTDSVMKFSQSFEVNGSDEVELELNGISPDTVYYASFSLSDSAGNVNNERDVFLFKSSTFQTVFEDSCDSDTGNFTSYADVGSNNWVLKISSYAYSNNICWVGTETGTDWQSLDNVLDESLQFGPVNIDGDAYLVFYHRYAFESGYDGAVIEASFDGVNFFDLGDKIISNGYNGKIAEGWNNPIAGRSAFTGVKLDEELKTVVDISSFAGKSVYFRFRIGCDSSYAETDGGWYIDDVKIESGSGGEYRCYAVSLSSQSVISAVSSEQNALTLVLYDSNGSKVGEKVVQLGDNSALNIKVSELFPEAEQGNAPFTLECVSTSPAGLFQMEDITDESGNMRTWTEAVYSVNSLSALVPYIASEFEYWDTYVQVMAPLSNADSFYLGYSPWFALLPFLDNSIPVFASREYDVVNQIFNGTNPLFDFGEAFISAFNAEGKQIPVCATESFRFKGRDNIAKLTLEQEEGKTLYVAHVDNSDYWWTGIAVVNPSPTDFATVDFSAFDENGNLIETKRVYLTPGERYAFVVEDEFSEKSAWFKISSDTPIVGYELFGTTNRRLLTGIDLIKTPALSVLMPVIDSASDWFGITAVNPFEKENNVLIECYYQGQKAGELSLKLDPYSKWVGLLSDIYDGEVDLVKITSDTGVVSFCLEGDKEMTKVGGVKGFRVY